MHFSSKFWLEERFGNDQKLHKSRTLQAWTQAGFPEGFSRNLYRVFDELVTSGTFLSKILGCHLVRHSSDATKVLIVVNFGGGGNGMTYFARLPMNFAPPKISHSLAGGRWLVGLRRGKFLGSHLLAGKQNLCSVLGGLWNGKFPEVQNK